MPAFFRQVSRDTGTRLFLYYSGMVDGIAGTRHPEWAQPGGVPLGMDRRVAAKWEDNEPRPKGRPALRCSRQSARVGFGC